MPHYSQLQQVEEREASYKKQETEYEAGKTKEEEQQEQEQQEREEEVPGVQAQTVEVFGDAGE